MISLEKKNEYLHYLLSALQQSSSAEQDEARNPPGSSSQLERTYKKALADYKLASDQLEAQTAVTSKDATELRARLDEKDKKAEKQLQTLVKYRADVARQSSFANGRPLSEEQFEGLQSQEMSEDLERERLRYITNKANVTQLEQKLKKKNELSGGVSDAEYHKLSSDLNRIDKKIKSYDAEIENMLMDREKLRKMESFLTTAISNYSERNMSKESELRELNEEIEEKRANLEHLNKKAQSVTKKIGYDASDLSAILQTRMVNDDFSTSENELDRLHAKLNDLVLQHAKLIETN